MASWTETKSYTGEVIKEVCSSVDGVSSKKQEISHTGLSVSALGHSSDLVKGANRSPACDEDLPETSAPESKPDDNDSDDDFDDEFDSIPAPTRQISVMPGAIDAPSIGHEQADGHKTPCDSKSQGK
mmetsp:Transcript_46722/g.73812  ORF Transcript_46722/g.73812 Transcript_46722/m.73812 type:complete len:127 (+) Transcript_46722:69-449(+)